MKTTESLDLTPELAGLEASLASAKPESDHDIRERVKTRVLLETCRLAQPETPDLIETILSAGEQRITLSLRQFLRRERFYAGMVGLVIGLIFGAIINVVGLVALVMLLKLY